MAQMYLFTLTPINRYFFGSNRSFSEGHYAVSMKYPTPPTILGFLRYTILMQNRITKTDFSGRVIPDIENSNVANLTGTSRMDGINDTDDNFGIIERISPVFIVKHNGDVIDDVFSPVPLDLQKKDCNLIRFGYEVKNSAISNYSRKERQYAILSNKDPKIYAPDCLGGKDFWTAYCKNESPIPSRKFYESEEVFKQHTSVGIGRKARVVKPGMFYTQIDYSLHKGYSLGFIVWLKENKLKNGTVLIGGERSAFRMKVETLSDVIFNSHPILKEIINGNTNFSQIASSASDKDKIIALSPLVLDASINDHLQHAIIEKAESVRMLKPRTPGSVEKSEAFCMIPAGSVLYPEKAISGINTGKIPYKIGYNNAIKIQKG